MQHLNRRSKIVNIFLQLALRNAVWLVAHVCARHNLKAISASGRTHFGVSETENIVRRMRTLLCGRHGNIICSTVRETMQYKLKKVRRRRVGFSKTKLNNGFSWKQNEGHCTRRLGESDTLESRHANTSSIQLELFRRVLSEYTVVGWALKK